MKDALCLIAAAVIFLVTMDAHADDCKDHQFDVNRIESAVTHQPPLPQHYVENVAKNSPELGPERLEKILTMIDEAYHAQDLAEWKKLRLKDCGTAL